MKIFSREMTHTEIYAAVEINRQRLAQGLGAISISTTEITTFADHIEQVGSDNPVSVDIKAPDMQTYNDFLAQIAEQLIEDESNLEAAA